MILGILILTQAMSTILSNCAPQVGQKTMAAIIQHESSWNPYAIGDNTTRKSYFPKTKADAIAVATQLQGLGHNLDAGLAQVNSENWPGFGLSASTIFDECPNVTVGAKIITGNYLAAIRQNWIGRPIKNQNDIYLNQQNALVHALSRYNSGNFWASMNYGGTVYNLAKTIVGGDAIVFHGLPPVGTPIMALETPEETSEVTGTPVRVMIKVPPPRLRPRPALAITSPWAGLSTTNRKHLPPPHMGGGAN